jgi:hypothetical protein
MKLWLAIGLILLSFPSLADDSTPLLYNRTHLIILRNHLPVQDPPPLPWQTSPEEYTNPALDFDTEVRDGMVMYNQEGWFNLSNLPERSSVLLAFSAPGSLPIVPLQQYAPLDILLVNQEGKIVQIIPNMVLSQLQQEIYPENPILAILLLKGGDCAKLSINPGDMVDYKIFRKPPLVLSAPPTQLPAVAAPAATKPVNTLPDAPPPPSHKVSPMMIDVGH